MSTLPNSADLTPAELKALVVDLLGRVRDLERQVAARDAVIVSDDACQFDVGRHALCWVHAERLVHRLDTFTDQQRAAQQQLRKLIWEFYADLKTYRAAPSPRRRSELRARFVRIFRRRTGFVVLDRLLARLLGRKAELLRVLERPEIPLHTNGSENDIRACVIKRKISGGTQSEAGRNCRDTFLGLAKTCAKLGVSFWDYLGHRLRVPGASIVPDLQNLVRTRAIAGSPGVLPRLHEFRISSCKGLKNFIRGGVPISADWDPACTPYFQACSRV